jgi:hypothetical protein
MKFCQRFAILPVIQTGTESACQIQRHILVVHRDTDIMKETQRCRQGNTNRETQSQQHRHRDTDTEALTQRTDRADISRLCRVIRSLSRFRTLTPFENASSSLE